MAEDEYKKIFAKNLKYYMALNGKNQIDLMNDLKISSSTLSNWCTGLKLPRMDKVQMLADYFAINKSDLLEENLSKSSKRAVRINVLGRVAAGIPLEAIEEIIDTEEISEEMAATGKFFGLRIKGDSMEPRINEGDTVIVRQQNDAESGDVVIAMVNGNDAVCKRLKKYAGGIMLLSTNPKYEPMVFSDEDIINTPVKIIGRVMELRAKF